MKTKYVYAWLIILTGVYFFISYLLFKINIYPTLQFQSTFIEDKLKIDSLTYDYGSRGSRNIPILNGKTKFGTSFIKFENLSYPEDSSLLDGILSEWTSAPEVPPRDSFIRVWTSPHVKRSYLWVPGQQFNVFKEHLSEFVICIIGVLSFLTVCFMFVRFIFKTYQ